MLAAMARDSGCLSNFLPPPLLGYRLPCASDMSFQTARLDRERAMEVRATYTTTGPTFMASALQADQSFPMWSELRHVEFNLKRAALDLLRAQVMAHNDVVQPINNEPSDRVYLSETGHRVSEAVRAACDGHPDSAELQAACRANLYAADIVIANFNHHEKD